MGCGRCSCSCGNNNRPNQGGNNVGNVGNVRNCPRRLRRCNEELEEAVEALEEIRDITEDFFEEEDFDFFWYGAFRSYEIENRLEWLHEKMIKRLEFALQYDTPVDAGCASDF